MWPNILISSFSLRIVKENPIQRREDYLRKYNIRVKDYVDKTETSANAQHRLLRMACFVHGQAEHECVLCLFYVVFVCAMPQVIL